MVYSPEEHYHTKNDGSWWESDARGIPLARVCDVCIKHKLARYRPEVLTDSNYYYDDGPIEAEDY